MVPAILIFDIGKTNKKVLLFNKNYEVVLEEEVVISPVIDEDGFPCDDLAALVRWVNETASRLLQDQRFEIKAINFSTYGASLVHLDRDGSVLTPLYNYLKPIDEPVLERFYQQFGGREAFSVQTGSPALNMLNSSVQLFWLKENQPEVFKKIHTTLHLPQYLAWLFTGKLESEFTSIGCHTGVWDFEKQQYHEWLKGIGAADKLPLPSSSSSISMINLQGKSIVIGNGMHDSSASLVPFVIGAAEPIAVLSTGTWNLTLVPGFNSKLTTSDYRKDCLYFLSHDASPVAASRIFLGNEFEWQVKRMQKWFGHAEQSQINIQPDEQILQRLLITATTTFVPQTMNGTGPFPNWISDPADLSVFSSFEEAYHKLILDLAWMQKVSMEVLFAYTDIRTVYASGGFARNQCFMQVLIQFFPGVKFYTAAVNNGSALGAALTLHTSWNAETPMPNISTTQIDPLLKSIDLSGYRLV